MKNKRIFLMKKLKKYLRRQIKNNTIDTHKTTIGIHEIASDTHKKTIVKTMTIKIAIDTKTAIDNHMKTLIDTRRVQHNRMNTLADNHMKRTISIQMEQKITFQRKNQLN